jgi:hypothetical protein
LTGIAYFVHWHLTKWRIQNMAGRPPIGEVAMTGAERQRRYWQKHRPARARKPKRPSADTFTGTPDEIADNILQHLQLERSRQVSEALVRRIAAIKPDCKACHGSGFVPVRYAPACGMPLSEHLFACDCTDGCQANPVCYVMIEALIRSPASGRTGRTGRIADRPRNRAPKTSSTLPAGSTAATL